MDCHRHGLALAGAAFVRYLPLVDNESVNWRALGHLCQGLKSDIYHATEAVLENQLEFPRPYFSRLPQPHIHRWRAWTFRRAPSDARADG